MYRANATNDPFTLAGLNVPAEEEVNVVDKIEKRLRSEKKEQIRDEQSQMMGSSGLELPDVVEGMGAQNKYLKTLADKYDKPDNVPERPGIQSVLGDYSFILGMQSYVAAEQNSQVAANQGMAMMYSTLQNTGSAGQKVVESQFAYDLTAAVFGRETRERKAVKHARKQHKMKNNSMYC